MSEMSEMLRLLALIASKLDVLIRKDLIPQIETQKNMSFLFDRRNVSHWNSFNPTLLYNMRLFGYYYSTTPDPVITDEGWYPLRVDEDSQLLVD